MSAAASVREEVVPDGIPSFRERLLGVLRRPTATFAAMTDPEAWLWPAVFLLAGYTVYFLAYGVGGARWQLGWMYSLMTTGNSPTDQATAQAVRNMLAWLAPASQLFGNLLSVPMMVAASWAVRSGVFYGLARLLGGAKPPPGRVAAMVGWAWVPLLFQYSLVGVLMLAVPQVMSFFLPLPAEGGMPKAGEALNTQWHGQMLFYLSPFVFWNLALCVLGVAELFRFPRWKASIVVLVPAVLQLLYLLATYVLSALLLKTFGKS